MAGTRSDERWRSRRRLPFRGNYGKKFAIYLKNPGAFGLCPPPSPQRNPRQGVPRGRSRKTRIGRSEFDRVGIAVAHCQCFARPGPAPPPHERERSAPANSRCGGRRSRQRRLARTVLKLSKSSFLLPFVIESRINRRVRFSRGRIQSDERWIMKGKKMTPARWLLLLTVIIGIGEVLLLAVRAVAHTP